MLFFNTYKFNISICAIIKDENEYLKEWLDYHIKIGVSHFFIYDNESSVPIGETVGAYLKKGLITLIDFPGKQKQVEAYHHCLKNFKKKSKWIAFIDTDEFIVPKSTNGDLNKFLKDFEKHGGLGVNWLLFGSSGLIDKPQKSQLESFILRSREDFGVNEHIKTIVHTKYVKDVGPNPHCFLYVEGKHCVNENFERIETAFAKNSTHKIQLNHYYCRSLEEYKEKISRGRADDNSQRKLDDFYAHDRDSNIIEDRNILKIINS